MRAHSKNVELIRAILVLPGSVLVIIPGLILYLTRPVRFLGGLDFPLALIPLTCGLLLLAVGFFVAVRTVALFFTVGDGTPAPWAPPKHFVVQGLYAYVRNPMLMSVLAMILGEALLFGSRALFLWWGLFWVINTVYFVYFEEPALEQRFGREYLEYKKNVGRWIPRRTPWRP
jgi:protein-S-isoprenylcysteine O-methyltransferase Ste14